ncbi:MAG: sodium:proton antiporter NhaD, partial [Leadbetterella sp.]
MQGTLYLFIVFVVGYLFIVFEHPLQINKAASSLVTGILMWVFLTVCNPNHILQINENLAHQVSDIAGLLFFFMAAMAIVQLIDSYGGFLILKNWLQIPNPIIFVWVIGFFTFFLSAILDNLTTTIIVVSILGKLVPQLKPRLLLTGIVVIAANAGGVWSPIGDVTTTMLWMGGQLDTFTIISRLFIPSLVSIFIPILLTTWIHKDIYLSIRMNDSFKEQAENVSLSKWILFLGIGGLILVPIFKTLTQLPPYMGILLILGIIWFILERVLGKSKIQISSKKNMVEILQKIDLTSILFFLGILLAVGAFSKAGILIALADWLDTTFSNIHFITVGIGLFSSILDNVPLVAACLDMYKVSRFEPNHIFWQLLSYCAGTGGSILVIGSAAGVAAMGLEKITFVW